ncbi:MAG: hypothetical protein HQL07_02140 [Nitrospirae bacterium]|nr:hypothetical protein [Magnetococcales bacterium]
MVDLSRWSGDWLRPETRLRWNAPVVRSVMVLVGFSLWRRNLRGAHQTLLRQAPLNDRQFEIDLALYAALQRERKRLTVVAPKAGWVAFLGKEIKAGVWVNTTEPLLDLTHPLLRFFDGGGGGTDVG